MAQFFVDLFLWVLMILSALAVLVAIGIFILLLIGVFDFFLDTDIKPTLAKYFPRFKFSKKILEQVDLLDEACKDEKL